MKGPSLAVVAWRNLWRQKRRTLLTLSSIVFGGFLAVLFTALQDRSFADFIDTAARLGGGHVTLQHPEYLDTPTLTRTVQGTGELRAQVSRDKDVARAVDRVTGQIMLATASDSFGAFFIAYDPKLEDNATMSFAESLSEGEMYQTAHDNGIILGKKLAQNLGVKMGSKVVYTMMDKRGEIVTGTRRLSGIINTGAPSLDAGLCLLPIDTVRNVLGYAPDESTYVAVFLSDARRSAAVARRLSTAVAADVVALTWDEVQPELASYIAMKVGGARFMEIIIAVLVAAGIFNTLFVSVMERTREFGIMMAIGYSPGQLFAMVMLESLWLGAVGIAAGALVTVGPYLYLVHTGIDVSAMLGGTTTEVAGVGFDPTLRVGIFPDHLLIIVVAVLIATLTAGLYPAWRAGNVTPVEAIRLV
jgi:ABC-type lipoprotein release transport system permease subunit